MDCIADFKKPSSRRRSWGQIALVWFGVSLAAEAASTPAHAGGWPRFVLTGWLSPPPDSTTPARYAEMANAGFNVALTPQDDPGRDSLNQVRMAAARGTGLRVILLDNDLDYVSIDWPSTWPLAEEIASRYRNDPDFAAWYLGDEPRAEDFPRIGDWFELLRRHDPAHPGWNNLLGRNWFPSADSFATYVRKYVAATHPSVLSNDEYEFLEWGDVGLLTENVSTLGMIARESDLPFWGVLQLVEHGGYRAMTAGLLSWQAAQWLAFGASGICYFTYWTPSPDPWFDWQPSMIAWDTGERTRYYDMVRELNLRLAPIGTTLAGTTWLETTYAGYLPRGGAPFAPGLLLAAVEGRATIGAFADSLARPLLFVVNSDSSAAQTLRLELAEGRSATRLSDDGSAWDALVPETDGRVSLALGAGGFALMRLSGRIDSLLAGPAPRLAAAPNPSDAEVRLSASAMVLPARVEIYDATGRRVWHHEFSSFEGEAVWRGEHQRGGHAGPGVYFARLTDARGTTTRRIVRLAAR